MSIYSFSQLVGYLPTEQTSALLPVCSLDMQSDDYLDGFKLIRIGSAKLLMVAEWLPSLSIQLPPHQHADYYAILWGFEW